MNLQEYQQKKELLAANLPKFRTICLKCNQPEFGCYCKKIKSFDPQISFVILIHPIEVKRRIATGRMSHLCLQNSYLIEGQDYSQNTLVQSLIDDPNYHSVILYPGKISTNLTLLDPVARRELFPNTKKLRIFVIDGTWATAKKMIRQSTNLHSLPRICFSSTLASNFRVRKQPKEGCYSTIEAIYHTIELLEEHKNLPTLNKKPQDNLLEVFNDMVERQLNFLHTSMKVTGVSNLRRYRTKKSPD